MDNSYLTKFSGDHMSGNATLALMLAAAMRKAGMNQRELAHRLGVKPASICRILSGRRAPSAEILVKICHELGVDMEQVYRCFIKSELAGVYTGLNEEAYILEEVKSKARADRGGRLLS